MAGKLLLGLLLCGGVAADYYCQALIVQGDTGFTGFLYAKGKDNVAERNGGPDGLYPQKGGIVAPEDKTGTTRPMPLGTFGYYEDVINPKDKCKPDKAHAKCKETQVPGCTPVNARRCRVDVCQNFPPCCTKEQIKASRQHLANAVVMTQPYDECQTCCYHQGCHNPVNLFTGRDSEKGKFTLQLDKNEDGTLGSYGDAAALVRWYKQEILKMIKNPDSGNSRTNFHCRLDAIVVRQTGKMREALLKDQKAKEAWADKMEMYLSRLTQGSEDGGDFADLSPSSMGMGKPSYGFKLFSKKEQAALKTIPNAEDSTLNDLTLESTQYLVSKNLHFSVGSMVKARIFS